MERDNKSRRYIVWLEDVTNEIETDVAELEAENFEVAIAQGFRQLNGYLKSAKDGRKPDAIILDIMIAQVGNLSAFFPVKNAHTMHGYAAGLVFLERVLEEPSIFPHLHEVPVVLNSKRALAQQEVERLRALKQSSRRKVIVLEKSGAAKLKDEIAELLNGTPGGQC